MKERALIYLVVVLVVVNVAALGTIIYQRVSGPFWRPGPAGEMMNPPDMPREITLSAEQRKTFRESRRCLDSLLTPIHAEMGKIRQEMMNEIESDQPDTNRIDQLLTEIGMLQTRIEKTMVHHLLQDTRAFSPEQRSWFLKRVRQQAKWQDKPMIGPGQGFGRGPAGDRGRDRDNK